MTLKTVPVTGTLFNPNGSVAANASVVATLTVVDTDGGIVVPSQVSTTADSNGVFTLNLWPNSRGVNGSQYRVRAQMPGALPGVLLVNLLITVPDSDPAVPVPISTITNRTGPAALSDAKAAMLAAQGFALQAQQAGVDAAAVHADRLAADASVKSVAFLYPTQYATAPTTRPDGTAIQNGDRYNNSTDATEYIRINGVWTNAANSAQAAQVSAVAAAGSATSASGSAGSASISASAALTAQQTAQAVANLRADTASGVSGGNAVANGLFFTVLAPGSTTTYNVYQNQAGTAVQVGTVRGQGVTANPPTSRTVDSIQDSTGAFIAGTRVNGLRVRWNNPDGRRVYSRVAGGKQQVFIADKLGESQLTYLGNNTAPEITLDKILFTSDRRGTAEPYFMSLTGASQTPAALLVTEHWQVTGQSLASGDQAAAALSTVNVDARAQMLSLSVAPPYGPRTMLDSNPVADDSVFDLTKVTGLTPLVEAVKNVRGETICSGFVAQYLKGQVATEKLVIDDHARGAAAYTNQGTTANVTYLAPGSMHFANGNLFQELVRKYVEAAGGAYRYAGMLNIHGHTDAFSARGRANYLSDIQDWRASYNGQARHRSTLHRLQPMFLSQMSNLRYSGAATQQCIDIALAQMDAHQLKTGFWLVTPGYCFPMVDDTHFTAAGNRLHGEYFGKVARRVLKEGVAWEPVYPKSWTRAGNVINVQFNVPVAPLIFDTSTVSDPGQGGFSYIDDTASGITVTGVAVAADGVSVNVTLSGTGFGTNPRFRIAGTQTGNFAGPVTGARSTLRDSDSEKGVLSGTPLYNYACIFEGAIV